jgi:hypothetical protein
MIRLAATAGFRVVRGSTRRTRAGAGGTELR